MAAEMLELTKKLTSDRAKNARLLRMNAALQRGLPFNEHDEDRVTEKTFVHHTPAAPAEAEAKKEMPSWLKNALVALAASGGSLGLYSLLKEKPEPPQVEKQDGSVLQYLEDYGYHVGEQP